MIDITRLYYFVFAALTIAGGVMGFVKAGSTASIVAGGISGVLIIVAAVLMKTNPTVGLVMGGVVALALAGQFIPKYLAKHIFMPAGLMSILSVIAIVLTIVAFVKK
jgi:uncharacterized membrane protein (UPF0136 family)